jgi:hypothetical protein
MHSRRNQFLQILRQESFFATFAEHLVAARPLKILQQVRFLENGAWTVIAPENRSVIAIGRAEVKAK